MSKRDVGYVRISRDRVGAGLGVDRQRHDVEQLAEQLGTTIAEWYSDNDLSAYSGRPRPEYRRLLGDMEAGRVRSVLCWHTDRLHRSPTELEEWIAVAEPRGIAVHTVKAGLLDLSTPSGRMTARITGAVARHESEHRGERVRSKREQLARGGQFLGGARAFGYASDGVTVIPAEAEAVADGTRRVIRGESLRAVARDWNTRGLTTPRAGKPWTPSGVREALIRDRNAGKLVHRGRVVGDASWPAIVSEDEHRAVVAVLSSPERRNSPGNQPRWLGSGLYLCGQCGAGMRVGTSGQAWAPAYRCLAKRVKGDDGRTIRHPVRGAEAVDELISGLLVERLSRPDAAEVFAPAPPPDADVAGLRAELDRLTAEREALAERFADGRITLKMLDLANDTARERQAAVEAELGRSQAAPSPAYELASADDVRAAWAAADLDVRRAVLVDLMQVTILPVRPGRKPGGAYFDPESVAIEWR